MKYIDKNSKEWSLDKGDWTGSYKRESKKPASFIFPVVVVTIIAIILLGIR